jgi:hypothetical protein
MEGINHLRSQGYDHVPLGLLEDQYLVEAPCQQPGQHEGASCPRSHQEHYSMRECCGFERTIEYLR